jgi:trigger factor
MQVKKLFPEDTQAQLTITANQTDLEPIKQHVLKHLQQRVKVAGFREGKVPLALVEKNADQNVFQTEFLEEAVNHLYKTVSKELRLRPVAQPEVSIKKFVPFSELEFELKVEIIGELTMPDYKQLKKAKPVAKVVAKDIEDVLKNLQLRAAEKSEVNRESRDGDELVIDFKGTDAKGEPVGGADGKDYPLLLGSNTFIPGFEPNLLGLKTGEEKAFVLKFPKDYGVKAIAGKDVTFTVTVKKVQSVVPPALDDAFAAKSGPFKTLSELKADIKKQLTLERQNELDRQYENDLVRDIAGKAKVAIPKHLIDEQIERMEDEERRNLTYRGQTWEEHLKEEGLSAEEHRQQKRPQALEQIKAGLVLSAIAEAEGLEVTPEELEVRIQLLKQQYQDDSMRAELDKPENRQDIASRILTEKTLERLVQSSSKK